MDFESISLATRTQCLGVGPNELFSLTSLLSPNSRLGKDAPREARTPDLEVNSLTL